MESRVAKLESDIDGIKTTLTDIKTDIRDLRVSMDTNIRELRNHIDTSIANLRTEISELRKEVDSKFMWSIGAYAALLAILAHGFHWI